MSLVAPTNLERCIPFTLSAGDSMEGARLGGRPPDGIWPRRGSASTVYLATIPISSSGSPEASIFLAENDDALFRDAGRVYRGSDLGPIQVVVHGRSTRGNANDFRSPLSERAIVLGSEQDDWYTSGDGERTAMGRHKIGGRPAVFKYWDVEEPLSTLLEAGFIQIMQLDVPGPEDDLVDGFWPFGDGMFHLLGREPFGEEDWACFWEN